MNNPEFRAQETVAAAGISCYNTYCIIIVGGNALEFNQERAISPGRIAGDTVLALIVGALLPVVAVLQISLLVPVMMLGGILASRLKARAGWIPVGALFAATLASGMWLMGIQVALIVVTASQLPAVPVLLQTQRKAPFFSQLKTAVIAYAGGLLVAMLIAYASFGSGMVAQFVNLLRAEYDRMPDATLQPLVEWVNSMLAVGAGRGIEMMTVDAFRAQLNGVLDLMQQAYAQTLPGALLSGALLSGMLTALWGSWTMARLGMATNESFVGMSGWFLPPQMTVGMLALWLVGLILMNTGYTSGTTVYLTISQSVGAVFAVQFLCALDRRMLRGGRGLSGRRVMIVLLSIAALIFRGFGSFLCYIGVASALFGSRGAVRQWVQKRQDEDSDRDDFDE